MSKRVKKELVPELRFPEFLGKEKWRKEPFSKLFEIGSGRDHKLLPEGDIPVYGSGGFMRSVNDYLYDGESVCIGRKGTIDKPIYLTGKFWTVDTLFYTHSFENCLPKFIFGHFQRINWLKYNEAGGVPSLSKVIINKIEVGIPPEIEEQQKIADCLSSIDELITAHTQKLEALKAHKKGLMQQLFPAEGETVPKLRFSEFMDAGEWELKPFSKFIKLYRGSSPRPIKEYLTKSEDGVNWIKIGDTNQCSDFVLRSVSEKITRSGAKKSRQVKKGELILANSMSYGATYLLEVDGCIYDGWFVLREYEAVFNKQFLLQLLNSSYIQEQYKKMAAGGVVQNISSEIVYSALLPKTSKKEQKIISEFLESIDSLIASQAQKIEALKAHKKGLMQQLFPAVDEVGA